jgi:hypothetical protein
MQETAGVGEPSTTSKGSNSGLTDPVGSIVYLIGPLTITRVAVTATGFLTSAVKHGFPLISSEAMTVDVYVPYLTLPLNVRGYIPTFVLSR